MQCVKERNETLETIKELVAIIDKHCDESKTNDQARIVKLLAAYYRISLVQVS